MSNPANAPSQAVADALKHGNEGVDTKAPPKYPIDLNHKTVTDIAKAYNSNCQDPRLKFVLEKLVEHVHDFAREVSLTNEEWLTGLQFLTQTGQMCSDIRQEFILLSDILGLSALVDSMNHPKPPGATEATVLGPFFTEDAHDIPLGESIVSDPKVEEGEPMFVIGRIKNTKGEGIEGARIETWETDATGHYDTQYEGRTQPDCRGRLVSGPNGAYNYRAIKPVAYPIPSDGPVGKLLRKVGRHVFRPAHLHMMIEAPEYEPLTTALYLDDDPFLHSDTVFGVKSSLVCKLRTITDDAEARKVGFKNAPFHLLEWDFVLCTPDESAAERAKTMPNAPK